MNQKALIKKIHLKLKKENEFSIEIKKKKKKKKVKNNQIKINSDKFISFLFSLKDFISKISFFDSSKFLKLLVFFEKI